jgi:hypothetical protein
MKLTMAEKAELKRAKGTVKLKRTIEKHEEKEEKRKERRAKTELYKTVKKDITRKGKKKRNIFGTTRRKAGVGGWY